MEPFSQQLDQLAAHYGVQIAYEDMNQQRQAASPETLLATLAALGAPLQSAADVPGAWRQSQQEFWSQPLEPVAVAWQGRLNDLPLRLPADGEPRALQFHWELESGESLGWTCTLAEHTVAETREVEGVTYTLRRLAVPELLPTGYHRLRLELHGRALETLVISAPQQVFSRQRAAQERLWGLFVPLYALHSAQSWGGGNLSDLDVLWQWTAQQGGTFVATLPLLAAFLDEPYDPSPYAPVSRLFWNEFYVDLQQSAELAGCPEAQQLLASSDVQQQIESLRQAERVDYRRQMALQRQVLELLAEACFQQGGQRRAALEQFAREKPQLEQYSRFRAVCERQRSGWMQWPESLHRGTLEPGDYDEPARRYHLYVQWLAHEQIQALVHKARQSGPGLYLDLPLGVHRHGFDTWRQPDVYALDVSGGAPPDMFFTKGQDWGFPPLHPRKLRAHGYGHLIDVLRHHLEHAGMLRIDHVMQLHRLYWIAPGRDATSGAYVQYPAEELYAILSVEAHRYGSMLVGENLGTVPAEVNTAMSRHGVHQMYVAQYACKPDRRQPLDAVPQYCVASLNTHDMPPFTAFWEARELEDLQSLGLFSAREVLEGRQQRETVRRALIDFLQQDGWLTIKTATEVEVAEVLAALHAWLAAGPAELMLVNLEDLWQEVHPQNVPGTSTERPNWQRKTRHRLEAFTQLPALRQQLRQITELRKYETVP